MTRLRSGFLTRCLVLSLLTWTAADLLFPSLCALDSEQAQSASSVPDDESSPPQDDCFCCSHNVDPVPMGSLALLEVLKASAEAPRVERPIAVARSIFHPPLPL